ncbi:hypothetical protein Pfo_024100 [Paulownia fortunei]|nr:hypothetical protein Pfo_024100 [Paulownia fortunei]
MIQKNRQGKKKSLCEKSMQLMVNIIKFSSFSLATMNLGDNQDANRPVRLIPIEPFTSFPSNSQLSKRKRSQAPLSKFYLMEQNAGDQSIPSSPSVIFGTKDDSIDDGSFSDYIKRFHRRNQDDVNTEIMNGKATSYIRRFHEKNSGDYSLAASTGFPLVLPPPPPPLKK